MRSANKDEVPTIIEKYPAASDSKDTEGLFPGSPPVFVHYILPDAEGTHIRKLKIG